MEAKLALALANGVIGKLGEIAAGKALDEASLLINFKNDFKWLEKKLRQIFPSLQSADEQSEHGEDVKDWLADVRNIALDAEDIIDECSVQHLYSNSSRSCVYKCSQSGFRWKMGRRIRELKDRITSAIKHAKELKLFHDVTHLNQPSTSERGAELRSLSFVDRDAPAVSIDFKMEEILTLLENPSIGVIAVVGMGGLGKTFLLQHLYNRINNRYDCSAWISVSQSCSLRKLQCDLASHINGLVIDNGVSDSRAAGLIHEKLDGRRCLIVVDDVWRNSIEGNLIYRLGLPTGSSNQCKIVVTTRSRDVADNLNAQHIYEMQHLSNDESWDLFRQIAFSDREGNNPPEQLLSLAHQIVKECGRLPLAVKTVAASMPKSSLTSSSDWESKLGQLKRVRNTGDHTMKVLKVLKLSYDSLPPHLKRCFAYFSFFPEDTYISFCTFKPGRANIYQDYVIYLWIAEGFIPQEEGIDQWDKALDYLHQLENLCLVEKNNVYYSHTIHDMLHELAVRICKEHDCEFDLPPKEASCRRLVVAKKDIATNQISKLPLKCHRFLRTLSFSENPGITSIPEELFEHVRVLRVLDLSRTAISTLPRGVGNLKLLKVLNLSYTEIKEVPECVRRLKCLHYLDISRCKSLQSLPSWIGDLKSLSYLSVEKSNRFDMPKGMSQLSSLRRLKSNFFTLFYDDNEFLSVEDVGNLTNLQELRFRVTDVRVLGRVEDGILDRLVKIKILAVLNAIPAVEGDREESSLPTFPQQMNVMKDVQQLQLTCFSVPSWICTGMENLTDLVLHKCSDYPALQNLPNLQSLQLTSDAKCRELPKEFGESGGFPKLARLEIQAFPVLEELPALEEGAMQRLEVLLINNCGRVKRVPEGLERLRRLKDITVYKKRSGELEERLKEGGEDWKRIKDKNSRIEIILWK